MKKSDIASYCFRILVVVALIVTIFFVIIDSLHKARPETGTDASIGRAYEISSDTIFADDASITNLYVGENEERLRVYDIEVSEDGKSLIIYFVDSDPIVFNSQILQAP